MQNTIQLAQEACQKLGTRFEQELALYLEHGYVVSSPERLMLFRPARTENHMAWLKDHKEANAWVVFLAVGKTGGVRWFFNQQPWTLPYLIWARGCRGDLRARIYSTAAFRKHI